MDRPLIVYLHGFTSGPQSRKVQTLAARLAQHGLATRQSPLGIPRPCRHRTYQEPRRRPARPAANLGINLDDFDYAPFNKEGGLGRVHQLFGDQLPQVIETLNRELAA